MYSYRANNAIERRYRPTIAMRVAQRKHKERMARLGMIVSEVLAFLAFAALLGAIVLGGVALAAPSYGPCATEDSSDCYWDAKAQGNGIGRSFINVGGKVYYTSAYKLGQVAMR